MKILYISNAVIPGNKASSVHVMKISSAISAQSKEFTLLTTVSKEVDETIFKEYKVRKIHIKGIKNSKRLNPIKRYYYSFKEIIKNEYIYTRWIPLALLVPFFRFTKKKFIFEYHGLSTKYMEEVYDKIVLKSPNVVKLSFITNSLKKDFFEKHKINKKYLILPDAADEHGQYIRYFDKNICFAGSLTEGKGINLVVSLANILPNYNFHIAGGTQREVENYKILQKHNNIIWYGYLTQDDLHNVYSKCSISLLPNQASMMIGKKNIGKYTSPMKLFEYMSYGHIIVASNLNVIREVLCDGINSALVDPEDIQQWKSAILKISNNSYVYDLQKNSINNFKSKYTWTVRAKKIIEAFNE